MNIRVSRHSIDLQLPFEMRDRARSIRGGRWDRGQRRWTFPATPHAAHAILSEFPELEDEPDLLRLLEPPLPNYIASNHLPPEFTTKLWDHQNRAIDACWNRPASMLAMEMRTGKTATAIALASLWGCRRVLITCPLSVVGVWQAEIELHLNRTMGILRLDSGGVAKKAQHLTNALERYPKSTELFVVINHESLWREPFGAAALQASWDLLIVDESHRGKAPGGKLSRYLARLAEHIPRRLALTGTPIPHNPLDAYAQYRFLDRSIYGTSFNRFKNRYAIMGGYGGHEIQGWQRMDEFSDNFHKIAFEVSTEEAFDLPDEMDVRRTAVLESKARKVYDSMAAHFWAEVESGQVTAANALVKLLRLQQVTSGWVKSDDEELRLVSTAKQNLLKDLLEDIPVDQPLVIFVRFVADIDAVREVCEQDGRVVGEVSGRQKDLTDAGTFPDDVDVMVCQIQSGSLGVNLSRASTAIFYSWGWSLGDVEQARARIRHSEQVEKLQFIHLVIENSIDERMIHCLKNRRDFIEDILDMGRRQ